MPKNVKVPIKSCLLLAVSLLLAFGTVFSVAFASGSAQSFRPFDRLLPYFTTNLKSEVIQFNGSSVTAYSASENPVLQTLLETTFELIFTTTTAQATLLPVYLNPWDGPVRFSGGNTQLYENGAAARGELNHALGVPLSVTERLLAPFRVKTEAPAGQYHSFQIATEGKEDERVYEIKRKEYIFVIPKSQDEVLEIDSYTTEDNKTYIVVNSNTTRMHLVKLLAHEMAITADMKTNLSSYIYNLTERKDSIAPSLRFVAVNKFLSIFRAMVVERQVMTELFSKNAINASLTSQEAPLYCMNRLNEASCQETVAYYANLFSAKPFLKDTLKQLWTEMPSINIRKHRVPGCLFLAEPHIRSHGWRTSGPRPRLGDWGNSQDTTLESSYIFDLDTVRQRTKLNVNIDEDPSALRHFPEKALQEKF